MWFEVVQHATGKGSEWAHDLTDRLHFDAAMGTLFDYGLVEPHPSSDDFIESRGYSIHSCLHSWIAHVLNVKQDTCLSRLALTCVASHVSAVYDDRFWLRQRRVMSHAIACSNSIRNSCEDSSWALCTLGVLFADQGKLDNAERMYLHALAEYEKVLGPDHLSTLDIINNLGNLYKRQDKLDDAERMHLRALVGKQKAWGPDHTSTMDTVNNLGILYRRQGKLDDAEWMYQRALAGKEKIWGQNHISTRNTVNNLGALYAEQGKLADAERMYLRALVGYEKTFGPDHTSTLVITNNLRNLYRSQGKR